MSTTAAQSAASADVYLEHEGERRIRQMVETVQTVPWSVTLAELAWTAGPVTLIAAQGGYWFGYGKSLPTDTLLFFVAYTLLAGVIGQVVRIIYRAVQGRQIQRRQDALTTIIDLLPETVFAVRDLSLEPLTADARRREAGWIMLRKEDPDPQTVAMVVEDLTGSARLAYTMGRVESYRRAGLHRRVADLLEEDEPQIRLVLDELREQAPAVAATLRTRLERGAPTLKQGVPREENFVERVLAAVEDGNESLLTLRDVEEMLVLAFELVNGRQIPMLTFTYRGRWQLARAADALEAARSDYQVARASGYSRLRALVDFLTTQAADPELSEGPGGRPQAELVAVCRRAITRLVSRIRRLRVDAVQGRGDAVEMLAERTATLETALTLYRKMQEAYRLQWRRSAALLRAGERWNAVAAQYPEPETALRVGRGHSGLRVREQRICLEDEQRIAVALALADVLREADWLARANRLGVDRAKRLAVEVALALEPHIQLSRPDVQRAINNANAPFFAGVLPGMSAARKAAVGVAVAQEVRKDMARAAEGLAAALVRHYRMRLTPAAIAWLERTFGADPDVLRAVADHTVPGDRVTFEALRRQPMNIPGFRSQWERERRLARELLELRGRALPTTGAPGMVGVRPGASPSAGDGTVPASAGAPQVRGLHTAAASETVEAGAAAGSEEGE